MGSDVNAPVDYQAVLADLRAKRDQLDKLIAGIEAFAVGGSATGAGTSGVSEQAAVIQDDSFFGMSIAEAAKKFLLMRRKAQSTTEIAEALERGGLPHTSGNFGNTVGTVLMRSHKTGGDIVNVKRGTWGLAAWYPGLRRKVKNGADNANEPEEVGCRRAAWLSRRRAGSVPARGVESAGTNQRCRVAPALIWV